MELRIEDLPKDVIDGLMKQVHEHPKYIGLAQRKAMHIKNGNYVMAMQVAKTMSSIEQECMMNYVKLYEGEYKKITELTDSMNVEDKVTMSSLGNSLVMLADVLESLIIETNSLLKKYHPDFRIEMFDKLNDLAKEARRHVRMLDDYKSDTFYTNLYGDSVDKLTEMVFNKAKSFTKKVKTHYEKESNKKTSRNAEVA